MIIQVVDIQLHKMTLCFHKGIRAKCSHSRSGEASCPLGRMGEMQKSLERRTEGLSIMARIVICTMLGIYLLNQTTNQMGQKLFKDIATGR